MGTAEKIGLAIVGLAIIATLVVNGPNTAKVVGSASQGFSNSITAAERG